MAHDLYDWFDEEKRDEDGFLDELDLNIESTLEDLRDLSGEFAVDDCVFLNEEIAHSGIITPNYSYRY